MADEKDFVLRTIRKDPMGADLQLSFIVAASSSYRHDTVLRPFPSGYASTNNEVKNYEQLDKDLNQIPSLKKFKDPKIQPEVIELLHWCLCHNKFTIKLCSQDKFSIIEDLTGHTGPVPTPTHIFEVHYNDALESRFQERRGGRELFYAYHGSRVENFHCILHYGLQGHLNKNGLFGEGTYLSSELSVSMPYAPSGSGWKDSIIGEKMSCLAVCEIIDDAKSVKCQIKEKDDSTSSRNRGRIANSLGGDIPEKYYVVRNNDSLRVKYLLVYAEKRKAKDLRQSWLFQHKFTVIIILYALILVLVGFYNSRFGQKLKQYFKS